jgi:Acyl-CoA dehydrogenase, C-terminal domain
MTRPATTPSGLRYRGTYRVYGGRWKTDASIEACSIFFYGPASQLPAKGYQADPRSVGGASEALRARHSDLMLLLARTTPVDEVKRRTDGLSVFLVDLRENLGQGVEIRPIEAMINHNTTEVFFDNLQVPPENLIGEEGRGFRYILDGMNAERILVAQECIGDGRWLLNKGIEYAKERVVLTGRSARTRECSSHWREPMPNSKRPHDLPARRGIV